MADHRDAPIISYDRSADYFTFQLGSIIGSGDIDDTRTDEPLTVREAEVYNGVGDGVVVLYSSLPGISEALNKLFVGNLGYPDLNGDWLL